MTQSLSSFKSQGDIEKHKRCYLTVCDGRKTGAGNELSTDALLKLNIYPNSKSVMIPNAYLDKYEKSSDVEVLLGYNENTDNLEKSPYIVIIKE
jgi:hypothetical protein